MSDFDGMVARKVIKQLFDGPLDIIGDVHGEINALRLLLWHLGYDRSGSHPAGRRLVFVGDLVDRGPDSPAVIELVKQFVTSGHAQCILGNHELNILRNQPKPGNEWFMSSDSGDSSPFKFVEATQKKSIERFLKTLPLALANDELRVVHACWHPESISRLDQLDESKDIRSTYDCFEENLEPEYTTNRVKGESLKALLKDLKNKPDFVQDLADHDSRYQNGNPVRVLTSGLEIPASEVFEAGEKWRMVERQKWWESYIEDIPVIVGHYWRRFADLPPEWTDKGGPDLFEGIEPHAWFGRNGNVYCVDFSVGLRHKCRKENWPEHAFKLAAVRWPEKLVMHDDGTCVEMQ